MALLTAVAIRRTSNGRDLVGVAAAGGGDTFVNNGREYFHVKNGSGAPITVTFVTPVTVDGGAVANLDAVIPAGASHLIGPFPPQNYNDTGAVGGILSVTYSGVTTLTVGVITI